MITTFPMINQGKRKQLYITSDNQRFSNKEEAEWHELAVCQLKQRKLTVAIPEHTIYTFTQIEEIEHFIQECYGHLHYKVTPSLNQLETPNNYVVTEQEIIEDGNCRYEVTFQTLETFKRELARNILSGVSV